MWSLNPFVALLLTVQLSFALTELSDESGRLPPTIAVAFLVRNKAHVLPYFLGGLEDLEYPKDRMTLWIRADHNADNSVELMQHWLQKTEHLYNHVSFEYDDTVAFDGEKSMFDWPDGRMRYMMELREEALTFARRAWADYLLVLDVDNLISYPKLLHHLIAEAKPVISPMLLAPDSRYSNFWAGMSKDGYYERTDDYDIILRYERTGCFAVPMIFGTVLIDLNVAATADLTYFPENLINYAGPHDDIIVFAHSIYYAGLNAYVNNDHFYGIVLEPRNEEDTLRDDIEALEFAVLQSMKEGPPGMLHSPYLLPDFPKFSRYGFDEVYLINLDRRPDRYRRMNALFSMIGLNYTRISAVDGQLIDDDYVQDHGISFLPEFKDPHHDRSMTKGEIGCFMSHYNIWTDVVANGHRNVLVFEDDLRFEKGVRRWLRHHQAQIAAKKMDYDLIYLGRKRLSRDIEAKTNFWVKDLENVATVGYTYWTLGYILSQRGAQKLLDARPLKALLPIDEYLPIMFDNHPEEVWKKYFPERNLVAYTAEPLVVHPSHYTNEPGYISDTEQSTLATPATQSVKGDPGVSLKDEL